VLPFFGYLLLNFDDETVREIKNETKAHPLTFGFGLKSDLRATDIILTRFPELGTNFKINYEGNIVPIWLKGLFGKANIYAALAGAAVGETLGLNLVEVSEALKSYQGLSGKMRLIKGIKKSQILDSSASASPLSVLEDLEILRKIDAPINSEGKPGRKIAVLGDILGIGKYTIEAHEALGEKIKGCADLLFTVGPRAKFFAQGAQRKGMPEEKIFQFDDIKKAGLSLQNEISEGDLILVDGSREMQMSEIVEEIKFIK